MAWLASMVLLVAAATPASAQPPTADPERDARARNHFAAGTSYYQSGDYEGAIREFRMSYELSRRPALLFNLANAYERNGQVAEAIDHLHRYIEASPEEPNRATLEERLANMRRRQAHGHATPPDGSVGGEGEVAEGEEPEGGEAPIETGGGAPLLGILSLGVAGVGLVSGLIFALLAGNEYHRLEETGECGATRSCTDGDVATLDSYSLVADLSFGLSLAGAVVGGIVLAF